MKERNEHMSNAIREVNRSLIAAASVVVVALTPSDSITCGRH